MKRFLVSLLLTIAASMSFYSADAAAPAKNIVPAKYSSSAKKAATLYGQVTCEGAPVAGVYVSDGVSIAFTDKNGMYYISSDKHLGSLFVSFPGGYEVSHKYGMAANWQHTDASDPVSKEQHDFELHKVDNSRHVILAYADCHMDNIFDCEHQFKNIVMPRIREEIAKYNVPVYAINVGDSSFDLYWYEDDYAIKDWVTTLEEVKFPVPSFTVMGNHDNDAAVPAGPDTDRLAEQAYRDALGPTWYSLNLGNVHYVFLDDIEYLNSEGRIDDNLNVAGKRDYRVRFNAEEIEWLKKDLATVTDKSTPIVMTLHAPLFAYKDGRSNVYCKMEKSSEAVTDSLGNAFTELTKDFEQVHYITGHTHKNVTCHGSDADPSKFPYLANVIDHNISGICGCWWQPGAWGGLRLAPDTAPAGFEMFPVDGKSLSWYYVSEDDGADQQFRVFDMNEVGNYYRENGDVRAFLAHHTEFADYGGTRDSSNVNKWKDQVLVHVWAWEPTWTVEATEAGKPVPVVWARAENPQFTISYPLPKRTWREKWPTKVPSPTNAIHMFRIQCSASDTPVTITVTDGFGRKYTQTVQRPKTFSKLMR